MLINMTISVNHWHWRAVWMNYVAGKLFSVWVWSFLYQAAERTCATSWRVQQEATSNRLIFIDYKSLTWALAAVWLFGKSPDCRAAAAALPGGRMAKDDRFMEAQTLPILHSHKTLTYLLCRLTARQAVSECTVPETSSSYFWNTHRLVSQRYKSTPRLPFAWYWGQPFIRLNYCST